MGVSLTLQSAVRDEVAAGSLHALTIEKAPLAKSLYAILSDALPPASPARAFDGFLSRAA